MTLSAAIWLNNQLHRVTRGRCWNKRICLKISCAQARRDIPEMRRWP